MNPIILTEWISQLILIRKRENTALRNNYVKPSQNSLECRFMKKKLLHQMFVFADAKTEALLNLYTSGRNCYISVNFYDLARLYLRFLCNNLNFKDCFYSGYMTVYYTCIKVRSTEKNIVKNNCRISRMWGIT